MGTLFTYIAATTHEADLEASVHHLALTTVGVGTAIIVLLVLLSIWAVKRNLPLKLPLFLGIVITTIGTTGVLAGGTFYLNANSYVGGPVHWHADFEMWACGNELALRDPQGLLSNKIGSSTLHEHNDKRIHLEGVPITSQDASLGKFMNVIGGGISHNSLVVPLNSDELFVTGHGQEDGDGLGAPAPELVEPYIYQEADGKVARFVSGERCGEETAQVQTFVFQTNEDNQTYTQTKLEDPADYAISQYGEVPPGDCIVMEFAPPMERTDKLCQQYGVRDADRCGEFGVAADQRDICQLREVQ